jgi:hypothetical protein
MRGLVKRVAMERAGGDRPSAPRALIVASAAGAAMGALTYRVLRS